MNNQLVANLLIFEEKWKKGERQSQLIQNALDFGFTAIEIRREYFFNLKEEIEEIKALRIKNNFELYYSIPDKIFVDGKVNPEFRNYISESKELGVSKVKCNIGDFQNFKGNMKEELSFILDNSFEVNVENDQSKENGTIAPIQTFLAKVSNEGLDIGFVYDIGNWLFVSESPETAKEELKTYTRYIHLKDVNKLSNSELTVVGIDKGQLDWRNLLKDLLKDYPLAIEYPMENNEDINNDLETIKTYLESLS